MIGSMRLLAIGTSYRAGISPEMALRLAKAFDTSPESWLNQQMQYDLWIAEQNLGELKVEKLVHVG